jgi:hypothetical protein
MDQSNLVRPVLWAMLAIASMLGCSSESTTETQQGGTAGMGGSGNRDGASAATGGGDQGGSSSGGSATGGNGAAGGEGGASWSMVGGCPSELCPRTGLPDGETCSVTVTCCTYQQLSVGLQGCTCTDGRWACGPQRCACPGS